MLRMTSLILRVWLQENNLSALFWAELNSFKSEIVSPNKNLFQIEKRSMVLSLKDFIMISNTLFYRV